MDSREIASQILLIMIQEGTPDYTFLVLREGTSEPLVVVEFKPTGVVQRLLSVIGNPPYPVTQIQLTAS